MLANCLQDSYLLFSPYLQTVAAKSALFLKHEKSLDICTLSTFCHAKDLVVLSFRMFWPGHGQKREHKPLCFYSQGSITSKDAQFICSCFFFNMTFSVLNNLWKLSRNSEQSSSYNAWNLKINGWWFRAWEILFQNQSGFMVTSEIQKKEKKSPYLKLWLSILEQNKPWSTRDFMCTYMHVHVLHICVCIHAYVFHHI